MPTILLIRHAQASFGTADYDVLSDHGHAQVDALLAGLAARGVRADRVVCGSLRRQRDTAEPCARAAEVRCEVDPRWNEYEDRDILENHADVHAGLDQRPGDAGIDSRRFQEILNTALRGWIAAGDEGPCAETWPAFRGRVGEALSELASSLGRGQTALAISSGGVIAALSAELQGLPGASLVTFNHVSINTAITKIAVGRGGTTLISSNEHGHLERPEGSLVSYR